MLSFRLTTALIAIAVISLASLHAATVVNTHGQLAVKGAHIIDQHGEPVSFAGPSLFWSNDGWEADRFYNPAAIRTIREEWNATLTRAAMGVPGRGGYLQNPESNKAKVIEVVDAAIEQGIYIIIDWHDHHAENHAEEAVAFFDEMSKRYAGVPNVIYEIYNEPLKVSWTGVIKPYALRVIEAIRANDPRNLIIVGTPTWSQDVDVASEDPILEYDNIAYTLHFYAGTHTESLREKARIAMDNGIALMVTEWGTVNADGDGDVAYEETRRWLDFMRKHKLSHCNWALNDKEEGASILEAGASSTGPWGKDELSESGEFIKSVIQDWHPVDDGGN